MRRRGAFVRWFVVALVVWLGAGFAGAFWSTRPRPLPVAPLTALAGFPVEDLEVRAGDGVRTRGWFVAAGADCRRAVVLAAGIGGDRRTMLARGEWYLQHGWSVALVDLRGTGASEPTRISFGWHEAADLRAWRQLLRGRGCTVVGAHGQSLGAAAIVYSAEGDTGAWDFAVIEACYGDLDRALRNRLPWVPWPSVLLWPMRAFGGLLLSVDVARLAPIRAIASLHAPTLLLCGDADTKVGRDESEALLAAAGASDKQLVWIAGAGHVDLLAADAATLTGSLAAFLAQR